MQTNRIILGKKKVKGDAMKAATKMCILICVLAVTLLACGNASQSYDSNINPDNEVDEIQNHYYEIQDETSSYDCEVQDEILDYNENNVTDEIEDILPFCYSKYIGIWRGYAILIFETLVITDVVDDKATFIFVNVMKACDSLPSASDVYTKPIIDSQITFESETIIGANMMTTITFHDENISLLRSFEGEHEIEWTLTPISLWW